MHQAYDQITFGIPGPTGTVTPELEAAKEAAVTAAAQAKSSETAAKSSETAAASSAAASQAEADRAKEEADKAASQAVTPAMTQSEAQAGTLATSRTVSPKVMGDEIKRLLGATAPITTMTAAQAQTGTATTSQRITAKVMGDEIKRLLGATAPITTMTAAQAQTGTATTSQRITAKVMGDEIDRRIASDVIIISGVEYKRSGVVAVTTPTWDQKDGAFVGAVTPQLPFTPPAGWGFVMGVFRSNGYVTGYYHPDSKNFRAMSANSSASLSTLWWQLIRID